jgi:hypothetical protein
VPFFYVHDGADFDIEELPLDAWIEVQSQTGKQWHECIGRELLADVRVAKAVLAQCAKVTGTTLPEQLTVKTVLRLFEHRDIETRPTQFREGTPDPKAQGSDPVTT